MTAAVRPIREFELLNRIYAGNRELAERFPGRVRVPPGDDMAAIAADGATVLAAVDSVVEGRHFRAGTPMALVGRKAVTRNLSDIAAMAARPLASLAAVVLPAGMSADSAESLFEAVRSTAARFGCPLVGGDIAVHAAGNAPLVCTVTVLATVDHAAGRVVTRSGAQPGDRVYVTGLLGATMTEDGGGHHLEFEPRLEAAAALLGALGSRLHAMIDISDGLGRDASHLAEGSNVRVRIDAATLPCRAGADWRAAMRDGEDYELCFAASGPVPESAAGVRVSAVGAVLPAGGGPLVEVVAADGVAIDASSLGWEHAAAGGISETQP
ncbi:MAG: thiamine-phosphate kinase [Phycisphaerales bacterium]|nr:thiamine-phosphate kinase [Phycisphaerales bacterium]